jgi:arsenite oxidase small subunit
MSEKPREEKKVDASRRAVIAAIGGLAVGGVVGYLLAPRAPPETVTQTVPTTTTVPVTTTVTQTVTATTTAPPPQPVAKYPRAKLANISELQPKRPVTKQYAGVNVWVVKLGERAVGGVGPDGDVVAFANLCTHMGGPWSTTLRPTVPSVRYTTRSLTWPEAARWSQATPRSSSRRSCWSSTRRRAISTPWV